MKTWFITGASRGFGALIMEAALASDAVVATARDPSSIADHPRLLRLPLDVTNEAQARDAAARAIEKFGRIDVLVNNAGYGLLGAVEEASAIEVERVFATNVFGLLNVARAVLPYMRSRRSGHIINMSSIAGRKVFKGLSIYCATKFAVAAFSDGLRMELAPKFKIRVTSIQPGAVATELYDHISDAKYRNDMEELAKQMTFLTGEDIGNSILYAVSQPAHVNVSEVFVLPTEQGW